MKILFVCKRNVGRSQMAAELYSRYFGKNANSAGIEVLKNEGQKLYDIPLAEPVIRFIKKEGIEVANNARTQLTSEMIKQFDKIIVIAEPEIILEYLKNNHKVEFWNIENPKNINDYGYKNIISQIKDKVRTLLLSH